MLGKRLKLFRTAKNLTLKALASKISASPGFISEVENGLKMPGSEFLVSLKRTFDDIDLHWLLTGEGEMRRRVDQAGGVDVAEAPIPYSTDRQTEVLHHKLQRVLDYGKKTDIEAVKGMLKALDPGVKKQDMLKNSDSGAKQEGMADEQNEGAGMEDRRVA
jgi:transcriptional regulator with XRE-family HTH domain